MFVQALAEYAHTYLSEELKDEAWEEKPVPYLLELAADGSFLGVVERMTQVVLGKKTVSRPQPLPVPRSPVNRNSGLYPLLGADDIKYVLGVGAWTNPKERENHAERHEAFVKLTREAARATRDPALESCERFYARAEEVEQARAAMKAAKPGSLVALSVNGPLVLRPAVQAWWREHYRKAFQERVADKGGFGECLISGTFGPIAPTHEKIKGISSLGGQAAGVSLMSFDKEAFRSYGWKQNENSPVSPESAMAYVLALNDLLRAGKGHRRDIAGVGFIYWLKNPAEFDLFETLDQPDEKQVEALLSLDPGADPEPNEFYMAGVSGNGGRLRVRYWVTGSLGRIKENLKKHWFEELRVSNFEESGEPVRFWQLLQAIDRNGEPPADLVIALLRRAIEGRSQPLGYRVLAAVLSPLRRAGERTPVRLAFVRLCVNDLSYKRGENFMTENLDPTQSNSAYLCGRLLAEYESLQWNAFNISKEPQPNLTVADRYYSLASTNPAIAFPQIVDLGRKHLSKLKRNKKLGMSVAVAIEQRLQELLGLFKDRFPSLLGLDDQGRFALGYYHQRAHSIAQAKARKAERDARDDSDNE